MSTFIFQIMNMNAIIIVINNNLIEVYQICGTIQGVKMNYNLLEHLVRLTFTVISLIIAAFQGIMHFMCCSGG